MSLTRDQALEAIADRYDVALDGPSPIALPAGRADLPHLCRALGFYRGAEVGVWKGAFSEAFCRAIPGVEWYAVDPWAPYAQYRERKNDAELIVTAYARAQKVLGPYGCEFMRMPSTQAARLLPDHFFDVVYLDGNHEAAFVRADLEAWTPKIRPGGLLCGHDYRVPPAEKAFIQVKPAVDAWVAEHRIAPWFVFSADRWPSFAWVLP